MSDETMPCGFEGCQMQVPFRLSSWFFHLLICHDIESEAAMYLLRERPPEPAAFVVI